MLGKHDLSAEQLEWEETASVIAAVDPVGTADNPEGLISWLVAAARVHSLSPRVFLKYLVGRSTDHNDLWTGTTFFERDCCTINGYGQYAQRLSDLVQSLSFVDVRGMTLIALGKLFPHNGEGMLSRSPRWCYVCLCEQLREGVRPHFKLAWYLEHYRSCHIHHRSLSERCPDCGSLQAFLPIYPSVIHCSSCGRALVSPSEIDLGVLSPPAGDFDEWSAVSLMRLIGRREELFQTGGIDIFRQNVLEIVQTLSPSNKKGLCLAIGLQPYALNGWLNKEERPSLSVLLRFCYGVCIHVPDAFLPNGSAGARIRGTADEQQSERAPRPMLGSEQRKSMERLLEVIISDPSDCRPLARIAEQLGLQRSALKYWFRQQCREIVLKNRTFESRRQEHRYRGDHEFLRSIVQRLRAQGANPSRRRVDTALSERGLSLARPDLFGAFEQMTRSNGTLYLVKGGRSS